MFLAILGSVVLLLALIQLALRRRLRPWLPAPARRGFELLALIFVLVPLGLFLLRRQGLRLSPAAMRSFMMAFTTWHLSSMILLALLASGGLVRRLLPGPRTRPTRAAGAARQLSGEQPESPERRRLLAAGMALAAGGAVGTSTLLIRRTERPKIVELTVPIRGLAASLQGLTLVQLTDLHSGLYMSQARLERHFAEVNDLAPDLVVLTGDLIDHSPVDVPPFQRATRVLRPRLGTAAVLGNHDFYTGAELVGSALEKADLHVLRNRHLVVGLDRRLHRSGTAAAAAGGLVLAGIDDPVGRWHEGGEGADLERAFQGAPPGAPRLLLSHRPDEFPAAARHDVALTLSGHTHGGQLILPMVGSAARLVTRFTNGLYGLGDSRLYVNRGLGVVGVPVRINCPAELTRIVLVPA